MKFSPADFLLLNCQSMTTFEGGRRKWKRNRRQKAQTAQRRIFNFVSSALFSGTFFCKKIFVRFPTAAGDIQLKHRLYARFTIARRIRRAKLASRVSVARHPLPRSRPLHRPAAGARRRPRRWQPRAKNRPRHDRFAKPIKKGLTAKNAENTKIFLLCSLRVLLCKKIEMIF
jgi:hypothetical protein